MNDADVEHEIETELDENSLNLYTEKATRVIYEVKLFEGFVLARPVTPELYRMIRKMSHGDFAAEFDEFVGNRDQVYDFLRRGGQTAVTYQ